MKESHRTEHEGKLDEFDPAIDRHGPVLAAHGDVPAAEIAVRDIRVGFDAVDLDPRAQEFLDAGTRTDPAIREARREFDLLVEFRHDVPKAFRRIRRTGSVDAQGFVDLGGGGGGVVGGRLGSDDDDGAGAGEDGPSEQDGPGGGAEVHRS